MPGVTLTTYRRTNHKNLHVRAFKEEGTTSTAFDMVVMNDLDRFHLVADVIDRVPALGPRAAYAKQAIRDKLIEHKHYISKVGPANVLAPRPRKRRGRRRVAITHTGANRTNARGATF